MAKSVFSSAKSYAKNMAIHAARVAKCAESPRAALHGVTRDTKKLTKALIGEGGEAERADAIALTEAGRKAYNAKKYTKAEKYFREAISEDSSYAWAHTYLGHTAYQQGKAEEAKMHWNRAVDTDFNSDAAAKARKKLQHLRRSKNRTVSQLKDRMRNGS